MFPTSPRELLKSCYFRKMSLDEMCSYPSQRAAYTVLVDRLALDRGWGHGDIKDVLQFVFWLVSVLFFLCGQYQQRRAVDRRFANVAADQEQAAIPLVDVQPQLMLL